MGNRLPEAEQVAAQLYDDLYADYYDLHGEAARLRAERNALAGDNEWLRAEVGRLRARLDSIAIIVANRELPRG